MIKYIIIMVLLCFSVTAFVVGDNITQQQVDNINFTTFDLDVRWERDENNTIIYLVERIGYDVVFKAFSSSLSLEKYDTHYQIIRAMMYPAFLYKIDFRRCILRNNTVSVCKEQMRNLLKSERDDLEEERRNKLAKFQTVDFPVENWVDFLPSEGDSNQGMGGVFYTCESKNITDDCPGGLSGGKGTRCYQNEGLKDKWIYCYEGWV